MNKIDVILILILVSVTICSFAIGYYSGYHDAQISNLQSLSPHLNLTVQQGVKF